MPEHMSVAGAITIIVIEPVLVCIVRLLMKQKDVVYRCGNNRYRPIADGNFQQKHSTHSNGDGSENLI